MLNILCIKWGTKYGADDVNRLRWGVGRWLKRDFRFVCFTDEPSGIDQRIEVQPIPDEPFHNALRRRVARNGREGAWPKISLFKPSLSGLSARKVVIDLDVLITGPLEPLIDHAPEHVVMRREWRYERLARQGGHGSICILDTKKHPYIYNDFRADPEGMIERYKGSEQYYTSIRAFERGQLKYLPGHLVCSFKRDAVPCFPFNLVRSPKLPTGCSVLCFHGAPKIDDAIAGYRYSFLRRALPSPWLNENLSSRKTSTRQIRG